MCSAVIVLSLLAAVDPVRIGITAMLIARPRPMLNLFAFWVGGIAAGIAVPVIVLYALRDITLSAMRVWVSSSGSPIVVYVQVAIGVLAVSLAVLLAVRLATRQRAPAPASDGGSAALLPQPESKPRGLSIRERLERNSLATAFVAGLALATPPVEYIAAIIAIVTVEPTVATQFAAALGFTLVAFTVVEVPLVTYLLAPAQTLAVVQRMNGWISERRDAIPTVVVAVVGVLLVAGGIGRV